MKRCLYILIVATSLSLGFAQSANALELITNGGFETGTLAGWTVTDHLGNSDPGPRWYAATGLSTPLSSHSTVGAASGNFYVVSDQSGAMASSLTQSFSVSAGATSVILSFDMFVNDWFSATPIINGGLAPYVSDSQYATVDLLAGGTPALATAPTPGVLANFYLGADPFATNPNPYTHYVFDITALTAGGGIFDIRFGEVDDLLWFNMGVDNVSVIETFDAPVPEPASMTLLGLGLAGLVARARRKKLN